MVHAQHKKVFYPIFEGVGVREGMIVNYVSDGIDHGPVVCLFHGSSLNNLTATTAWTKHGVLSELPFLIRSNLISFEANLKIIARSLSS